MFCSIATLHYEELASEERGIILLRIKADVPEAW